MILKENKELLDHASIRYNPALFSTMAHQLPLSHFSAPAIGILQLTITEVP